MPLTTPADTSKFWLIATGSEHICKDMLEDTGGFQLELDMDDTCPSGSCVLKDNKMLRAIIADIKHSPDSNTQCTMCFTHNCALQIPVPNVPSSAPQNSTLFKL